MAIVAPFLPYDKLRHEATKFLALHHPSGELPIPIERIIEFKLHMDIVPMPGLQDGFDVDAFITSDFTEIRVDQFIQENRPTRYRFSLAHEVSHLIIHGEIFKQLAFSTIAEWKDVMGSIPEEAYSWIEWQAYALAGLILVPDHPLHDLFDAKIEEARKAGVDLQEMDDDARRIVEGHLGRYFEVSAEVINKRMKKDGLWERSR
jgi:hypothetical protein